MPALTLQHTKVAVDGGVEDGLLVSRAGVLLAVLVRLEASYYEADCGGWHLEIGFGRCAARPSAFSSLDAALRWIASCIGAHADVAAAPALEQFGVPAPA